MKKIVIVGSSAIVIKIIELIRNKNIEAKIYLASWDKSLPFDRNLFPEVIAKGLSLKNILCKPKDFYSQNNVECLLEHEVTRINPGKRKVFFEDKSNIEADILIICDTPESRFPDIKGNSKTGIFGLRRGKDVEQISQSLFMADSVAIQSNSLSGLKIALAIGQKGKEVIFVTNEHVLFKSFDLAEKEWIGRILEEQKIQIVFDNEIAEVLGDAEAKAIRTKTGKVFSCEIIIFLETNEDVRLFSDSELQLSPEGKINVNERYKTNIENVYAVDTVANNSLSCKEDILTMQVLEEQAAAIVSDLSGDNIPLGNKMHSDFLKIGELNIDIFGSLDAEGAHIHKTSDLVNNSLRIVYEKNCICTGAILVNVDNCTRDKITDLIQNKKQYDETPKTIENIAIGEDIPCPAQELAVEENNLPEQPILNNNSG